MGLWSRIRKTFLGDRHNAEIQEELRFHFDMDVAGGRAAKEARVRLGGFTKVEEETRAMGIVEWLDSGFQDARYGLRQLRKTPGLVLAVVLSLAIGVGANTAIFSLIDAALLKPLPVKDSDSLRIVEWTNSEFPEMADNINGDFTALPDGRVRGSSIPANLYRSLARQQTTLQALVGVADPDSVAIKVAAAPAEQVSLQYVSGNFFQGLRIAPVIGRPFREDEDRAGQEPVVIVSHRFWMSHSGGNSDIPDRDIRVNNVPARIVGVAPAGFFGLSVGEWTDVYAPLAAKVAFQPGDAGAPRGENDRDWWVRLMARLKPGVPEAAAKEQIAALFRNLARPAGSNIDLKKIPELITLPGRRGFGAMNPKGAKPLWILMLLVGVLLAIVCANVGNLLMSRSVGRRRESAVRLALGARRTRLFRQHLIESGMLALLGGGAGLGLGDILAQAIHFLFQFGRGPSSAFDLHLDARIFGFTGAISILTALLFGLAPALQAARADAGDALKAQNRSVMGGALRLPKFLVSVQMALCLTALVAAGLLGRSLENLEWMDVGFDTQNLAYASVNPRQAGYSPERMAEYVERVREALARLPGVIRVSPLEVRLLSGNGNASRVSVPGRVSHRLEKGVVNEADYAVLNRVGDGFFETLRIPLVEGRTFAARDSRPGTDAVVVDKAFARRFFPNENPLGRRFGFSPKEDSKCQIVGVAGDTRYNSLRSDAPATVYMPYVPGELQGPVHFAIRARVDSRSLAEAVRKAVASVDPAVPLTEFHTQTALIDRLLATERLLGFVSGAFGAIALILAGIGLSGLLAYAVARRTNEIGVRMALGAVPGDVIGMVLRDAFWMAGAGILIGLPCAYAAGKLLETQLFHLKPLDPWTAAVSFLTLFAIAMLAAWIPARRAARVDPMTALREE